MYDADAASEAVSPPRIRLGGREYTGRVLSILEWAEFEPRFRPLQEGAPDLDAEETYRLVYDYTREVFPRPLWHRLLLPWRPWVPRLVLELPPKVMIEAVADFVQSQVEGMGITDLGPEAPVDVEEDGGPADSRSPT